MNVVRNTPIPWDPDTSDLKINTDSAEGSGEKVALLLNDENGVWAGNVLIYFASPIKYFLGWCTSSWTPFPITPPTETEKTWRISYTQTSQQLEIFCNDVNVLRVTLSDDVCGDGDWRDTWERDVKKIEFDDSHDTASDKYYTGGIYTKSSI